MICAITAVFQPKGDNSVGRLAHSDRAETGLKATPPIFDDQDHYVPTVTSFPVFAVAVAVRRFSVVVQNNVDVTLNAFDVCN